MESRVRLYIRLPEEHNEFLKSGEWDHGIVVTDLNPHVTNSQLHAYFQKFGKITECDNLLHRVLHYNNAGPSLVLTQSWVAKTAQNWVVVNPAFFRITIDKSSGWPKGVGFVRYSSSEEAEAAKADEPLGGFPIWINKIVTPKVS